MFQSVSDFIAHVVALFLAWPLWGQFVAIAGGVAAVFGAVSQTRNLYRWIFIEPGERRRQAERDAALQREVQASRAELEKIVQMLSEHTEVTVRGFEDRSSRLPSQQPVRETHQAALALGSLQADYFHEYDERTRHYVLSHIYVPSREEGQKYETYIFVVRHQRGDPNSPYSRLPEVGSVAFFLGHGWQNTEFPVKGMDDVFSVRVQAWGTFLAACRITFKDPEAKPVTVFRYIDFWMDPQYSVPM